MRIIIMFVANGCVMTFLLSRQVVDVATLSFVQLLNYHHIRCSALVPPLITRKIPYAVYQLCTVQYVVHSSSSWIINCTRIQTTQCQ